MVADGHGGVGAVAFHPNGEHFFSVTDEVIQRWRVADGQEVAKQMGMLDLNTITVSRDGKWIVYAFDGGAGVWDAELKKKSFEVLVGSGISSTAEAVDISPESTRFAAAASRMFGEWSIWSITTGERLVGPFDHRVIGIKFSPDGRRIAAACEKSINIFDSYNGDQLIITKNLLAPQSWYPITPILWPFDDRLFATSKGGKIKSFDTSTGAELAEWAVHSHDKEDVMSIAMSANNSFIASSAGHSVSFWDTSTHTQLGSPLEVIYKRRSSMALSPDGTHLATGGSDRTITIWNLSDILPESYLPIRVSTT